MTVVGIAGCTALLLTGFGLHDAIWDIIDKHFEIIVLSIVGVSVLSAFVSAVKGALSARKK